MHAPTPCTAGFIPQILQPDLRPIIEACGNTTSPFELVRSAESAVRAFRSIPPRKYNHLDVVIQDGYVSTEDASQNQPPTAIRVYIPSIAGGAAKNLPVLMWSHHGGFFSQGPIALDHFLTSIAYDAQVIVVAPAYRQTPEHRYPAPFDDVYQVLMWLATSSEPSQLYSIDTTKIAIGGTSAGGTVSFGALLKYLEDGHDPSKIRLLILEDASFTNHSTSYSTGHNPVNKFWNANITSYMWEMYLPDGVEALDEEERGFAVPALVRDEQLRRAKFPHTMVLCAQWDDLTNDAIAFAHRLLENGVSTEIHIYRGTFHISDKLVHGAKMSVRKRKDIVGALGDAFDII